MLQISKSPSVSPRDRAAAGDASAHVIPWSTVVSSFVGFFRRRWRLIFLFLLLTVGLAAVYLFTAPPRFTAHAKMSIESPKFQVFQQQAAAGDGSFNSIAELESQVEILKSENVELAIVKSMHLTEVPEFVGSTSGFKLPWWSPPTKSPSEFELTRRALSAVDRGLTVKRVGLTHIIDISFESLNPDRAASVANAIAEAYVADQLDAKSEMFRRGSGWLETRLKELREQTTRAEAAVVDYKEKNNIVATNRGLANEQQVSELNSSVVKARAETAEAKARTDRVQQIINMGDDPGSTAAATVTETLQSAVITKLRQSYLDLRAREADWSKRFGSGHLAAVSLRNQMREISRSIFEELRRIAETYKSDYEIAKAREESINKSLSDVILTSQATNQAQVRLHDLESTAETYHSLYGNFLQRYMESIQQQSFPISEARLITRATRPLGKSAPKSTLILTISAMGGLILGIGTGLLWEALDRKFRTGSQVETVLGIRCLAVIPSTKSGKTRATSHAATAPRTIERTGGLLWQISSPFSRFAEEIRKIKTTIDLSAIDKSARIIGITSALPNEGKSTISAALAGQMSQGGAQVILLDCDLRNPSLTRALAPNASMGWIDVIQGRATLAEIIWTDPFTKLMFLPASMKVRDPQTGAILASKATQQIFEELRKCFDYILVDLPPLAPIADVRATTNLIDSYLLVIEWGRTKIEVVEHALGESPEIYENLIGAALNKANVGLIGRYDSHLGKYYHNRHFARYGYTDG
jgi:polysaccharide biosynthesis transport protein